MPGNTFNLHRLQTLTEYSKFNLQRTTDRVMSPQLIIQWKSSLFQNCDNIAGMCKQIIMFRDKGYLLWVKCLPNKTKSYQHKISIRKTWKHPKTALACITFSQKMLSVSLFEKRLIVRRFYQSYPLNLQFLTVGINI